MAIEENEVGGVTPGVTPARNVGWYDAPITECNDETRDLLERYSHFPPNEVVARIVKVRDQLWDLFPFPTVGQFRFVELNLHRQQIFPTILARVQEGDRFLDVGCCFGQEMRKMALEGAPTENMYGLELQRGFVELAYDFFGDRDTFKGHFIVGDLADPSNAEIKALHGTVDIAHLGMFLHLWDLEGQTQMCTRIAELMSPKPGSLVIGHSAGRTEPSEWFNPVGKSMYKHNGESFAKMWEEVGKRTGSTWKVNAWLQETKIEGRHWDDPQARKLMFEVERQ
ncbi:hypothetical protein BX600DRAFT_511702 [Xylariales sp. PMI_506]|nr:hypothetical protein BX600DRAFT_511702 [Xylariales sp. PMI_506]